MVGDQIRVEQKTLFQNRDYPVLMQATASNWKLRSDVSTASPRPPRKLSMRS
jgi:hypothetical protein